MAINTANLHFRESSTGPNRGGTLNASTDVTPSTLFDAVTGNEAAAGEEEYRGIYFTNEDATAGGLMSTYLWISAQTPGGDDISVALAGEGNGATMETISDYFTPPSGESFSAPANKAAGLSMGTIAASTGKYGIWVKRNVPAATNAYNANSFTLSVEGDSAA